MKSRFSRIVALLTFLALVATACAQQGDAVTAGEAPESLASTEGIEEEAVENTGPQFDRLVVAARGDINASPLWIADAEGFFERNGIEVDFLPVTDADELAASMRQNLAQVAVESSATSLGRIANSRADISLIAYIDGTNGGAGGRGTVSLVAHAPIDEETGEQLEVSWTGCDLVGLRIGVDSVTSLQAIALREMLRNSECSDTEVLDGGTQVEPALDDTEDAESDATTSLAEDDSNVEPVGSVEFIEVDAATLKDALKDGTLDAGVFAEPNTTRLLREKEAGTPVDDSSAFEDPVTIVANLDQELCGTNRCANSVVVASNTWIDSNGDLAARFNASIEESIQWILQNELDYRAALVSCCALTTEDASEIPKPNFVGNEGDFFTEVNSIIDVLVAQEKVTDRSRLGSDIIRVAE